MYAVLDRSVASGTLHSPHFNWRLTLALGLNMLVWGLVLEAAF
jgi:hypothetical protein